MKYVSKDPIWVGLPTPSWEIPGDLEAEPRKGGVWRGSSAGAECKRFYPPKLPGDLQVLHGGWQP